MTVYTRRLARWINHALKNRVAYLKIIGYCCPYYRFEDFLLQMAAAMFHLCKKHLKSVEEGYFQHMRNAGSYGFTLIFAGLAALIHAVFPAFFQTTASDTVARLNTVLEPRAARTKIHEKHAETRGGDA